MPRRTSHAESSRARAVPIRVVIVTLDSHLAGAVERARAALVGELPGLELTLHAASDWHGSAQALERCRDDIARADIVVATMLFMEEHIDAVKDALAARRNDCDAMVCAMSAGDVMRLTRMGRFQMDGSGNGKGLLQRLRGAMKKGRSSSGARQMAMLRRIPRILRFIPGTAQDVRAYFLTLQYWLAGTERNVTNLVRFLVNRYADGPRRALRGSVEADAPEEHHDVGLYHPRMKKRVSDRLSQLPGRRSGTIGRVGLLLMRSYVLSGDTGHYDTVIEALESQGLEVVPAFASGLDARPAADAYFLRNGEPAIDALVSLTGFSLVGGPAYNDGAAAAELLEKLDVPYIAAHPIEFQTLESWRDSASGLHPVESTMMVAIPELDGATGPIVVGGRSSATDDDDGGSRSMRGDPERARMLAKRVHKLVSLQHTPRAERRLAIVLFNFPPNAGSTGTAAHLSVYESLHHTLAHLRDQGYAVDDLPQNVDALRDAVLGGNAAELGADANVHARIAAEKHLREERWLDDIEAEWGPAPGRAQSDGESIHVLGVQFGNVLVAVQPAFGYEGDPMRLLFEQGLAPPHAVSAFYRYLREGFDAHAVLHFGTHGALEFMPGKQTGLGAECWPDRLIDALPNFYLYTANNPSEGAIAKRRSAATLISYLTPPVTQAGLYRGLHELKASIDRWRSLAPHEDEQRAQLSAAIQAEAHALDLAEATPQWGTDADARIDALGRAVLEVEYTLIPHGLHVVGEPPAPDQRVDLLLAMASVGAAVAPEREAIEALVDGASPEQAIARGLASDDSVTCLARLAELDRMLARDYELPAIVRALDGRFVPPAPGGDLLSSAEVLPTGRNLHGFDPYRLPSSHAVRDGARRARMLLDRHAEEGDALPELVALVLWGTDNLKSQGEPIAQALALIGARPRHDSYGRLAGAELIPLEELGRPRIDVMMTLSGIFRDLLPLQTRLLAEAAFLAASADEPLDENFVRKHALAYQQVHDCDLETAALRVFSNAEGAYGSNVNHLIDQGCWSDEDELAESCVRRKCYAFGRGGTAVRQPELMHSVLADVQLTYQNLESIEVGVTTLDHYFDTLGGISRAVKRARGERVPVYIADPTHGASGTVRTLSEQVALESRTRILNPRWQEGMLEHGYEGVRHIEAHVTNTLGWSATTGEVAPWVYRQITQTFVLDEAMRRRMAALNPVASARVVDRLLEAQERDYWDPDEETLEALRAAGEQLEDALEGVEAAA